MLPGSSVPFFWQTTLQKTFMNANEQCIAAHAQVDAAAIAPLPNSHTIYVEGSRTLVCPLTAKQGPGMEEKRLEFVKNGAEAHRAL